MEITTKTMFPHLALRSPHGVGTHAISELYVNLHGTAKRFISMVEVDDEQTGGGTVKFIVIVDGKLVVNTPVIRNSDAPVALNVNLVGAYIFGFKSDWR